MARGVEARAGSGGGASAPQGLSFVEDQVATHRTAHMGVAGSPCNSGMVAAG
jgi:hypothetical protein